MLKRNLWTLLWSPLLCVSPSHAQVTGGGTSSHYSVEEFGTYDIACPYSLSSRFSGEYYGIDVLGHLIQSEWRSVAARPHSLPGTGTMRSLIAIRSPTMEE